jgi:hypothetical protein
MTGDLELFEGYLGISTAREEKHVPVAVPHCSDGILEEE